LKVFISDVNFGDDVSGKLKVANFGKEPLTVVPVIEIYSDELKPAGRLFGEEKFFGVGYGKEYEISLNDLNLSVGKYLAVVIFEDFIFEDEFGIGEVGVDILNYTEEVVEGLDKFEVEIENLGKDKFEEVYAEVRVIGRQSEDGEVSLDRTIGFDSSIVSLGGWEKKKLVGYFDSEGLDGEVMMSIDVHYDGEVNSQVVRVYVEERVGWVPWIGLGFVLIFLILWLCFRSK